MSDDVDETNGEARETTPEETGSEHPASEPRESLGSDVTGVYGTAGGDAGDVQAPDDPGSGDQDPGSGGPATAVYGTTSAASPQWSTPGSSPQQTTVQPIPGQAGTGTEGADQWAPTGPPAGSPPTQAYPQAASPQPAPTQQVPAGYAQSGYAPSAAPAPTGGRHWNLWAGVPLAASVLALGYLWRLIKIGSYVFDQPVRQQVDTALYGAAVVLALLTLVGLASRKRSLAAPLAFLLGGVMLAGVVYGWYLQMDYRLGDVDFRFLIDQIFPITLPALLLALVTMVSAFLMRVDDVWR